MYMPTSLKRSTNCCSGGCHRAVDSVYTQQISVADDLVAIIEARDKKIFTLRQEIASLKRSLFSVGIVACGAMVSIALMLTL